MRKILFANVDLLKAKISGISYLEHRDSFLAYVDELCDGLFANKIVFICKNIKELQAVKTIFMTFFDYPKLYFATCYEVKEFVARNKGKSNSFVFISSKENDLNIAVNSKSLFIAPAWIPLEPEAKLYGVNVETPKQFFMFIKILNNQNSWFSTIKIDKISTSYALMDARYMHHSETKSERKILLNFQNILKRGKSLKYYEALKFHFLSGITNLALHEDIEIFGMIPSSDCTLNPYIYNFMEQICHVKKMNCQKVA